MMADRHVAEVDCRLVTGLVRLRDERLQRGLARLDRWSSSLLFGQEELVRNGLPSAGTASTEQPGITEPVDR
jgi:predicted ATPase